MTVQQLIDELRQKVPDPETTMVTVRFEDMDENDEVVGVRLHPSIRVLEIITRLS